MLSDVQEIKQKFSIIGNDVNFNRGIDRAIRVASANVSVLIVGESGTGKENIPKIIHQLSNRKHAPYMAINCGSIPEGTIDSELFGHEKGAFTGSTTTRSGYFEVANTGILFLDEVGELPLNTQVRLLRVLETGEFMKVGSSKIRKTDVRIIAATNVKMQEAVKNKRFREDLYYRLNTVEINLPPLRERGGDIHLLFRKFSRDFAEKNRIPAIKLSEDAINSLNQYHWPGNIRQLKNFVEQLSILEVNRNITKETLQKYLPKINTKELIISKKDESNFASEREILYKILFDMKSDLNDLKKLTLELLKNNNTSDINHDQNTQELITKIYGENPTTDNKLLEAPNVVNEHYNSDELDLSLETKEKEMIQKAIIKHRGKRKDAAKELGISERTLYRKIKQYNIL